MPSYNEGLQSGRFPPHQCKRPVFHRRHEHRCNDLASKEPSSDAQRPVGCRPLSAQIHRPTVEKVESIRRPERPSTSNCSRRPNPKNRPRSSPVGSGLRAARAASVQAPAASSPYLDKFIQSKFSNMRQAFLSFDIDYNGGISMQELRKKCKDWGIPEEEAAQILDEADFIKDGKIDFSEFVKRFELNKKAPS